MKETKGYETKVQDSIEHIKSDFLKDLKQINEIYKLKDTQPAVFNSRLRNVQSFLDEVSIRNRLDYESIANFRNDLKEEICSSLDDLLEWIKNNIDKVSLRVNNGHLEFLYHINTNIAKELNLSTNNRKGYIRFAKLNYSAIYKNCAISNDTAITKEHFPLILDSRFLYPAFGKEFSELALYLLLTGSHLTSEYQQRLFELNPSYKARYKKEDIDSLKSLARNDNLHKKSRSNRINTIKNHVETLDRFNIELLKVQRLWVYSLLPLFSETSSHVDPLLQKVDRGNLLECSLVYKVMQYPEIQELNNFITTLPHYSISGSKLVKKLITLAVRAFLKGSMKTKDLLPNDSISVIDFSVDSNIWEELAKEICHHIPLTNNSILETFTEQFAKGANLINASSDYLDSINADKEDVLLIVDSVGLPSTAKKIPFVRDSHDVSNNATESQLKMTVVYNHLTFFPLYAKLNYGNLPDITIAPNLPQSLLKKGFKNFLLVADKGYASKDFYSSMLQCNYKFLVMARRLKSLDNLLYDNWKHLTQFYHENGIYRNGYRSQDLFFFKRAINVETLGLKGFEQTLEECEIPQKALNPKQDLSAVFFTSPLGRAGEIIEERFKALNLLNNHSTDPKYKSEIKKIKSSTWFENNVTLVDGKYTMDLEEEGKEVIGRGTQVILTNYPISNGRQALEIYANRVLIEPYFATLKSGLGIIDGIRVHSRNTAELMLFTALLAATIHKNMTNLVHGLDILDLNSNNPKPNKIKDINKLIKIGESTYAKYSYTANKLFVEQPDTGCKELFRILALNYEAGEKAVSDSNLMTIVRKNLLKIIDK